ncbi:MAG: PilT/PilU family type 4a pilus ATPase [Candidatus Omnitrophota bacterium]
MNDNIYPQQFRLRDVLEVAVKLEASDTHLVIGRPPIFRIQGKLKVMDALPIDAGALQEMIYEILTVRQRRIFEETCELDFSYLSVKGYYFRINVHRQKGSVAATIRIMPGMMKTLSDLGLSPVVAELTMRRVGLILIVGRAGMGKTTTMMHMIERINTEREAKIVTIEDPIEMIYESKKSLIVQREVGIDTQSFAMGLKYALRQDPDVVVVGEMRDSESIAMALTAAETGHLVLATLHSPDAIEAINRIIDVYPGEKQNQIRVLLAENLVAVIAQQLLPRKDCESRVLATEMMISNIAIKNLIRRDSLAEIRSQMESGRDGAYTLEQCLSRLFQEGVITAEVALSHAKYPQLLKLTSYEQEN